MNGRATSEASNKMNAALGRMLIRYPYHAEWLSPERWFPQPAVGTMAVCIKDSAPTFLYSPAFVCSCSGREIEGVIHHEINHLVFGHPQLDRYVYDNHHALTIAEEITVNEHVPEPLPGEPLTLEGFPELPPGEGTLERYHRLADRDDLASRVRTVDLHSLWHQDFDGGMMPSDIEALAQSLANQLGQRRGREVLRRAISGRGRHDGGAMMHHLRDVRTKSSRVDWERILSSTIGLRVQREATFHRPPRRMPDHIGLVPGMVCRPDKPPVLAVIDTSSSMQRPHFERFRYELERLRKLADITVLQCDKAIRKTFALRGPLDFIVGRGGTDLRPPLEAAVLGRLSPSLVLYFTDGDGPAAIRPPSVPVVWCLTADAKTGQINPPAAWGRVVDLR